MPDVNLGRFRNAFGIAPQGRYWTAQLRTCDEQDCVPDGLVARLLAELPRTLSDTFDLDYFLTVSAGVSYSPIIVSVRCGGELAGLLFACQREIFGRPIGVVHLGHFCGDDFLIAREGHECSVLSMALSNLFSYPRVHTMRAWIKPGDRL